METVAQNAIERGNICFSEKRQSNKEVGGWGVAATTAARIQALHAAPVNKFEDCAPV